MNRARGALLAAGLAGLVGCGGRGAANDAGTAGSGGAAGGGGAGTTGGQSGGGGAGGATSLPTGVLVFFGHSAVGPAGIAGYGKHDVLSMRYQANGLSVMISDTWPTSLDAFRLVILPVPGYLDSADVFLDAEVAALSAFLVRGGTLYVENEFTDFNGTGVINDLLTRFGSFVRAETSTIAAGIGSSAFLATEIGNDPLLAGVTALGFNSSSRVLPDRGLPTVAFQTEVVMAIEKRGAGRLVVTGDQQFIDDIGLTTYDEAGGDNLIFADHLAGLP